MPATKVAVVYSKSQKVIRRIIVLNHENAEDHHLNSYKEILHPNEGWLEIDLDTYKSFGDSDLSQCHSCQRHVAAFIGEPTNDRCVVIDADGKVTHICKADPAIDTHPGGEIIQHDTAEYGHRHLGGGVFAPS